jgi:ABC-type sugar transport system substrate-binding protein
MQDFVARAGRGRVLQVVNGDWSYTDAEQKAHVLLTRYPQANTLWAAADSMALGALRAVQARGAGVRVGGMVGLRDALQSVADGGLSATAAGHYLIGAWAMVLLHDHHRGADFAEHGGPRQKLDYLYIVDRARVARYDQLVFGHPEAIDFRALSKILHPSPGGYDFRLEPLLRRRPA